MVEKTLLHATLGFLVKDQSIALGLKKRAIGEGLLNGFGGGLKTTETPIQGLLREGAEECGVALAPNHTKKVAVVDFHNHKSNGETFTCRVYVFLCTYWLYKPQESEEMGPLEWFPYDAIPFERLMPADRDWLPEILGGRLICAEVWYEPGQQIIEKPTKIKVVTPDELARL